MENNKQILPILLSTVSDNTNTKGIMDIFVEPTNYKFIEYLDKLRTEMFSAFGIPKEKLGNERRIIGKFEYDNINDIDYEEVKPKELGE